MKLLTHPGEEKPVLSQAGAPWHLEGFFTSVKLVQYWLNGQSGKEIQPLTLSAGTSQRNDSDGAGKNFISLTVKLCYIETLLGHQPIRRLVVSMASLSVLLFSTLTLHELCHLTCGQSLCVRRHGEDQ